MGEKGGQEKTKKRKAGKKGEAKIRNYDKSLGRRENSLFPWDNIARHCVRKTKSFHLFVLLSCKLLGQFLKPAKQKWRRSTRIDENYKLFRRRLYKRF